MVEKRMETFPGQEGQPSHKSDLASGKGESGALAVLSGPHYTAPCLQSLGAFVPLF